MCCYADWDSITRSFTTPVQQINQVVDCRPNKSLTKRIKNLIVNFSSHKLDCSTLKRCTFLNFSYILSRKASVESIETVCSHKSFRKSEMCGFDCCQFVGCKCREEIIINIVDGVYVDYNHYNSSSICVMNVCHI